MKWPCSVRARSMSLIAALLSAIGFTSAVCWADIPPALRLTPSKTDARLSEPYLVISASDKVEPGQQEHPSGAVFSTDGYCSAVLRVSADTGARALLNVMGSDDVSEAIFGNDKWYAELPPVAIENTQSDAAAETLIVPLHHKLVELFLSLSDQPGRPAINDGSVGGAITVYATGVRCGTSFPFTP